MEHLKHFVVKDPVLDYTECWEYIYKHLVSFHSSSQLLYPSFGSIQNIYLTFFHQDPIIAKQAAFYMRYLILGLLAYGILQNLLRFLQTQSIVKPLALFSALTMGIHIGVAYALVYKTSLGFKGAPLAASISFWISTLLLSFYVLCAKKFEHTWKGLHLNHSVLSLHA